MATIAFNAGLYRLNVTQGQARILKLATALAWSDGGSLEVTSWVSGGNPIGLGKWRGNVVRDFIRGDDLPYALSEEAWVALALFREGVASKNVFYSFLSLFKVIGSIHRDGRKREDWFRAHLGNLDSEDAIKRYDELHATGIDVAKYLFMEGRNAIAHAEKEVFVNPDEPLDYERISRDLPVVRNLAEIAIEEQFGLLRRRTRYHSRGLDIVGFKEAIGQELWQMLLEKSPEVEGRNIELPDTVALVARRDAAIHVYEGMRFGPIGPDDKGIRFLLTDASETVQFSIGLNLQEEELFFEALEDMGIRREPESVDGIDRLIKYLNFQFCLFCNGCVEVWDEKTGLLLGKAPPYMLENMMIDFDRHKAQIAQLEARKAELMKA
ncbi:conserved protein of unknown function [Cupriavidus taiwanensis]|nr:conserved protein of unknown function [Cupriavidus taiwanensis]